MNASSNQIDSLDDVLSMLSRAATLIEQAWDAPSRERGRALATVAATCLRALEVREVKERLEAVERALAIRGQWVHGQEG